MIAPPRPAEDPGGREARTELDALKRAIRAAAAGEALGPVHSFDGETAAALLALAQPRRAEGGPLLGASADQLALVRDLHAAVRDGDLRVAYQPKLNLRTGRIDSAEALLRWSHPVRGAVPPDSFIALAEETGHIAPITDFVLATAIADQARLRTAEGEPLALSVNLSGRLVADEGFCRRAMVLCAQAQGRICMEITETAVIADPDRALSNLRALKAAGIGVSIDDYGSGLSSLEYLKTLPADELKIDKSFVSKLATSHRDPLIVRSTIDLAHALEMTVTAEGVDDPTVLALLKVMGCDHVQGFLISQAVPAAQLAAELAQPPRPELAAPRFGPRLAFGR